MRRRAREAKQAPARGAGRRVLLAVTGLAAGMGALIAAIGLVPTTPSRRIGEVRGVMPPLLRAIVPGIEPRRVRRLDRGDPAPDADDRDVVFYLLRAEERTFPDRFEGPSPIETIILGALSADDGWRAWSTSVAITIPRGGLADAAILGLQGRTLWVWADGLHAFDATRGETLADPARLAELNPGVPLDDPGLRRRLGFVEALTLDGPAPGQGWAFDPASLRAFRRAAGPPAPLPPPVAPAGEATPLVAELRAGGAWFGVLPADVTLPEAIGARDPAGRFLPPAALGDHGPWRLWGGRLRRGAGAPSADDVLEAVAPLRPLPGEGPAGLLGLGGGAAPDSVFVAHDRGLAETGLIRLGHDGRVLWEARIDAPVLIAALEGPRPLVLIGGRGEGGRTALFSVTLADGSVRKSGITA